MGRKVHPIGFRLGYIKDWQSKWYAERNYTEQLHEDLALRKLIAKELANAGVSRIEIERSANKVEVTVYTAKPGIVIGKRGQNVDLLKNALEKKTGKKIKLNIQEIHQPELDAQLVAESIGEQITKRVSYKRAMKQAVQRAMRLGAQGVKIRCAGRLGGAEMARIADEAEGRVPRHTLRADIDYAQVHAHTTYGRIGVKVWIYKGEVFPDQLAKAQVEQQTSVTPAPERSERGERSERRPRRNNDNASA
ncbi:30S ribosomal protein S3 [Candidatus Gracilibacteria bacterium]|nr:30S ribosomal protein S3 [Candidatus Gracilibacteria bacterium]